MSARHRWYAVDRLEGDRVVLVDDDDGGPVEPPLRAFPFPVTEGMVLRVPLDTRGRPDWTRAARDEDEERRRLEDARARLERLKRRDPGGDLQL